VLLLLIELQLQPVFVQLTTMKPEVLVLFVTINVETVVVYQQPVLHVLGFIDQLQHVFVMTTILKRLDCFVKFVIINVETVLWMLLDVQLVPILIDLYLLVVVMQPIIMMEQILFVKLVYIHA